ncbi:RNA polymerase sigma factor [Fictibacillus gelatini]|uniref:RNA polymerase sigma factor n=1 Tax=Fictibacillus gelatini TaxID=225985 RepID=UPI0003FEA1AD|nr:sigma-70 family RNA polymerase sigma factor [Fictibacillus gelatini]
MEEQFVKQLLQGDEKAFDEFTKHYRNYLFRVIYSVLQNEKDAEDVLQEVLMKIHGALPRYNGKGLKTWITRIAVNHSIDWKRKIARRKEDSMDDEALKQHASSGKLVELPLLHKETKEAVHRHLDEMPGNYRDVIYAFYIEEKSYKEIASDLNLEVANVKMKLHRGRSWMKKHWKEEDFK